MGTDMWFGGGDTYDSLSASISSGMKHALDETQSNHPATTAGLPPMKKRHLDLDEPNDDEEDVDAVTAVLNLNPLHRLLAAAATSDPSRASGKEAASATISATISANTSPPITANTSPTTSSATMSSPSLGSPSDGTDIGAATQNPNQALATRLEAFQEARRRSRASRELLAQAAAQQQLLQLQQQQQQQEQQLQLNSFLWRMGQRRSSSSSSSSPSLGCHNTGSLSSLTMTNADLLFGQQAQNLLASASASAW